MGELISRAPDVMSLLAACAAQSQANPQVLESVRLTCVTLGCEWEDGSALRREGITEWACGGDGRLYIRTETLFPSFLPSSLFIPHLPFLRTPTGAASVHCVVAFLKQVMTSPGALRQRLVTS